MKTFEPCIFIPVDPLRRPGLGLDIAPWGRIGSEKRMKNRGCPVIQKHGALSYQHRKHMLLKQMEAGKDQARPEHTARPASLRRRRGSRVCTLALLLLAMLAAQADPLTATDRGSSNTLQDPADEDHYDDHNADYPDDGSRALRERTGFTVPEGLMPIGPTEEEGLLGDWGDSEEEAED
jgi:hypothetical protein